MARMLTGKIPFFDNDERNLVKKIVVKDIDFIDDRWSSLNIEVLDLIENLLEKNPDDRL